MEIGGKRVSVARGLEIFVGITVLTITLLFIFLGREMLGYLTSLKLSYAIFAALLTFLMWCSSAMKFHLLLRGVGERISFWKSLQAFMANLFMGAITPSQTGGGIAQIYILNRAGVPLGKAIIACTTGAALTIFSLFSSALIILLLNHGMIFSSDAGMDSGYLLRTSVILATLVFAVFLSLFLIAIVRMDIFKRLFMRAFMGICNLLRLKHKITYTKKVLTTMEMFSESVRTYCTTHARLTLLAGVFSYISLAFYCLIASVILSGLGVKHSILSVVLIQVMLNFISYFFPTPGASGAAEGGSFLLMSVVVTDSALRAAYTILWRLFTTYIGVTTGGFLFTYALNRSKKSDESTQNC